MVRAFLYFIATMIVLVIIGMFALNIWSDKATEFAFVPKTEFVEQEALADNAYNDPDMWYSRPGIGTNDPARYQPAIAETQNPLPRSEDEGTLVEQASKAGSRRVTKSEAEDAPPFAVFFVHPTSYIPTNLDRDIQWNAALGDKETEDRADLFLRGLASPFNRAAEIWAPRYRQATVGAFITDKPEAEQAIDAAYRDVEMAFDYFLESVDKDRPIVLAGHSQGSLHLLRLLRERVKGRPLEDRIAAVYAVGWPISVEHDLPELPFPACAASGQAQCILSWSSFADGGDPDFFGAEPEAARFVSTSVDLGADGTSAEITGNLTLNGVTRPVTIDARFTGAGAHPRSQVETVGFEASGTILRSEFGIGYAIPMVSDEVELKISAAFEKQ